MTMINVLIIQHVEILMWLVQGIVNKKTKSYPTVIYQPKYDKGMKYIHV